MHINLASLRLPKNTAVPFADEPRLNDSSFEVSLADLQVIRRFRNSCTEMFCHDMLPFFLFNIIVRFVFVSKTPFCCVNQQIYFKWSILKFFEMSKLLLFHQDLIIQPNYFPFSIDNKCKIGHKCVRQFTYYI